MISHFRSMEEETQARQLEIEEDLTRCLEVLRKGGVVLYPTDTIWGIGCDATDPAAVQRVFSIKKRSDAKAMISLVDSLESLEKWVDDIPEEARRIIMESEDPVSVIFDSPKGLSKGLLAEDGSAAFRIPHTIEYTVKLCRGLGAPLVSTSANISGQRPSGKFDDIPKEIIESVDYVCEYGRGKKGIGPSRIIKVLPDGTLARIR